MLVQPRTSISCEGTGAPIALRAFPNFPEFEALQRARHVLGGRGEDGRPLHPSMFDAGVVSFAHGEGLRRPHPTVIAAGVRALLDHQASSLENYLFLQRLEPLDEAIRSRFVRLGVPKTLAGNIAIDSGTTRLIGTFLDLVAEPNEAVLTVPGFYHPLAAWCSYRHLRLFCIPAPACRDFKITHGDLERWWAHAEPLRRTSRPVAFVLFNPTMTGAVYSQAELDDIAAFLATKSLVVLEDAIFAETEFAGCGSSGRIAASPGMQDKAVTITGASKVHSLANIRIGWACGPADIMRRINDLTTTNAATIPQIAKLMALAALRASPEYLAENRAECELRASLLRDLVETTDRRLRPLRMGPGNAPAIRVAHDPQAGHSILLDLSGLTDEFRQQSVTDSVDLTRYFLTHADVAFSPGISIGHSGLLLRCNFASVGTHTTFRYAESDELAHALAEIRAWSAQLDQRAAHPHIASHDALVPTPFRFDEIFAAGRDMIRTAWNERVLPTLERLVGQFSPRTATSRGASIPGVW